MPAGADSPVTAHLLRVVDLGLCGVIFVAPYFFGGRHDLGRLVLVSLIGATAAAWFVRQALLPAARWPRTCAHAIVLLAAALLVVQIIPLPPAWHAWISPTAANLLPLWSASAADGAPLGAWQTASLAPHETAKSLAMLLSYGLLFATVAGRIQERADIHRILNWMAFSAVLMAIFGVAHFLTSDGRFFWFYDHPFRSASSTLCGPFTNRNHFANFLLLGFGPLVAWLLSVTAGMQTAPARRQPAQSLRQQIMLWSLVAAVVIVALGIVGTGSRGGALAFLAAGVVLPSIYMVRGLVDSRCLYGLIGLAIVTIGLLSLHGYDDVIHRLDDFAEGSVDAVDSRAIRRSIWNANATAFQALWPVGAGAGTHREICPVYMPESFGKEFTHAENGYLQVATETGVAGAVLLAAGILLCGGWCVGCFRHATQAEDIRALGAAGAGLAASVVHSLVDFVWYIPACMSFTILLAVCALRQWQLARSSEGEPHGMLMLRPGRWMELAAAVVLIAAWTVHTYFGPAMAALSWDRYMRAAVASRQVTREQVTDLFASRPISETESRARLNELMIRQLEQAIEWDARFARAHLRLAGKCIARFELLQQHAENAMSLAQIRDAAMKSPFASPGELQAWLQRAVGGNYQWLLRALDEARQAASLCPLQGEAYVYLAQLSFLNGGSNAVAKSYIDQALRVRPYDADVRFEVGWQELMGGNLASAVEHWKQCFDQPGSHQLRIVYLLAGRIPAPIFLSTFKPDWQTLRYIWGRYRELGQAPDLEALLAYSAEATQRETHEKGPIPPAFIWYWQSTFYRDLDRDEEALACLERANACDSTQFSIRHELAKALEAAGRFAEAEPHLRWCVARKPQYSSLSYALVKVTKQRLAQQERAARPAPTVGSIQRASFQRAASVRGAPPKRTSRPSEQAQQ
jgi:tetratricopeptide (TPR) repeat protein